MQKQNSICTSQLLMQSHLIVQNVEKQWRELLKFLIVGLTLVLFHWPTNSVQFSCSVMSNSLWPHGLQHTRPPGPSPTPRVYSESVMPSNHLILCRPLLPHLQSFPALESFQMRQFFTSGGQSIRVAASASVLSMNIQDWFPLGLTGLISFHAKGLSRVFSNTTVQKHQFFGAQLSSHSNSHIHTWPLEKP